MKRFVYVEEVVKVSKTYGYRTIRQKIYEVKKNNLNYISENQYNTGSCRGSQSEVNEWLLDNNIIPKTWSKAVGDYMEQYKYRGVYYTPYYYKNDKYEIIGLN